MTVNAYNASRELNLDATTLERVLDLTGDSVDTPSEAPEPVDPEPVAPADTDDEPGVHPESKLEAGDVLVIPRGERTELVTANDETEDEPYTSVTHDENGNVYTETTLDADEILSRLSADAERTTLDAIDAPDGVAA